MEILTEHTIVIMTGYTRKADQEKWFKERGYTYETDAHGNVWTTDDWLNNLDRPLEDQSHLEPWELEGIAPIEWVDRVAGKYIFTVDEILNLPQEDDYPAIAVYFLININKIVYVGQSVEMNVRIPTHQAEGKVFDSVRAFGLPHRFLLDHIEMFYIHKFEPELNKKYLPVSEPLRKYL